MKIPFINSNENNTTIKFILMGIVLVSSITYVYYFKWWNNNLFLLVAAILWLYMAMNIWANDIANNMWPAVWSKALSLVWAIIIAWIFEAGWAIIAWWDVVDTIKWWIVDSSLIKDANTFIIIMMSTLLWAALWLNIATFFKAPVSTTHSVVWWLIWAWVMAEWMWIVDWSQILTIASSWVISPVMWWIIAVIFVMSIRHNILKKDKRWEAAKIWVPIYVWIMSWSFATYLILKWLKQIIKGTEFEVLLKWELALFLWYIIWVIVFVWMRIFYSKKSALFKNSKIFINKLFNIPLVFAVSLLSFAHWANDVANAIWPLAAINETVKNHLVNWGNVWIPFWIMWLWAIWIVLWLSIFWARLIKTVWWEITKLNQIRAFCVALSAAITVIVASWLGLPVSSTHIALWWIFWVWLYREYIKRQKWKDKEYIRKSMIKSIALAWLITLPISWVIAAITYKVISTFY